MMSPVYNSAICKNYHQDDRHDDRIGLFCPGQLDS